MTNVSDLARELASRRRIVERPCLHCGTPVSGTARRRYCTHACKLRHYAARKKNRG
jgi:endogenous inhibitor of DNA gyrase (YacG/DUF329 family)